MNPVVLISRTAAGDAFTYARYVHRERTVERTDAFRLDPVPIGTPLPALPADDVELLRTDPEKLHAIS